MCLGILAITNTEVFMVIGSASEIRLAHLTSTEAYYIVLMDVKEAPFGWSS
jgi:hypothetical protein